MVNVVEVAKREGSRKGNTGSSLFENAVHSIQIGIADYRAIEPARALSAARNLHAGMLLLAKKALVPDDLDLDHHGSCRYCGQLTFKDD